MPQLLKENEVSYYLGEKHIYPKVEGGGGSSTLSGLSDVDTTGVQNGQVLKYNSTTTKWEPGTGGGGSAEIPIVNHTASETTVSIEPNKFHVWPEMSSLNITLATPTDLTIVNQYTFEFTSGSTATTLSLPSGILWPKGNPLTSPEANMIYEINIRNNKATWSSWEVTS